MLTSPPNAPLKRGKKRRSCTGVNGAEKRAAPRARNGLISDEPPSTTVMAASGTAISFEIGKSWGLPDHHDVNCYPFVNAPLYRWGWEFNRRRPIIREAFMRFAWPTYQSLLKVKDYDGPWPDQPGFWAMPPLRALFGMAGIPNPSISDQPFLETLFERSFGQTYEGAGTDYLRFDQWTYMFLPAGKVFIEFDPAKPHEQQLETARRILARYREPLHRHHESKWQLYLRVLDAREAGESYREIASSILRHHRPEPQAARDVLKQALALRDNFPL